MPLIEPGKRAPAFTLSDQSGGMHALKDYAGRAVVLYFYPKDDTDGCTKEACAFRDLLPKFESSEAAVLGVSPDSAASHAKFAAKHALTAPLASDADGGLSDALGVWGEKSLYGRLFMGMHRTTYLVDAEGRIARVWRKVKVKGHAAEVLAAAQAL